MEDYESNLLVNPEVFVYRIPPRTTVRGYRAADWNLSEPNWTGRMRLVSKNKACVLKLEDKNTGELFAKCPIDGYPSTAIEAVTDSSRYFVVKIQSDDDKSAFIGLGFEDRSDSFDLNVTLQDHFKWVNMEEESKKVQESKPGLDLGFKEGETIKISMKITKKDGQEPSTARPKPKGTASGLLPPPPGVKAKAASSGESNFFGDFQQPANTTWGEFTSASTTNDIPKPESQPKHDSTGWVKF